VTEGALGTFGLTRIFVRFRLRSFRNGMRARGRGRLPLLVTAVGLLLSFAYVGLFVSAFSVVAHNATPAGQTAALAVVAGALALGSLAAKAASNEAARAGTPENEFLLARPVSLSVLVAARGLADAVTDPLGALFLLPILVATAIVWQLGAAAWAVAIATSLLIQVTISMLAYATQLAVVRYVGPRRRRAVWTVLRLGAALALATMWMLGTWVLRAPELLARWLSKVAGAVALSPPALVAAPLAALRDGRLAQVAGALGALALCAVAATLFAAALARRAGLAGWEEAGATWAEASLGPRRGRPPTAATKDLRLIVRDRPQLLALVAMPILFVGVQVFGAAGWTWSTGSIGRVSCLAYSLALYTATIGPLAHMQAERRAFWILRSVPVPLERLLAAKARAWAAIVGGVAAVAFFSLVFAVPAPGVNRLVAGLLVVVGGAWMSYLAVAMAASGADLSDEQRPAVGPATIYTFLLVGGLYNVVLVGGPAERVAGLLLYLFAIWAYWRAGVARALDCMDAEALRARPVRLADGAAMLVIYALGANKLEPAGGAVGMPPMIAEATRIGLLLVVGFAAGLYLVRRPPEVPRWGMGRSALTVLALAAGLGVMARPLGGLPAPGIFLGLVILAEELLYRGVLQRALEAQLADLGLRPGRARLAAAAGAVTLAAMASGMAGGAPGFDAAVVCSQAAGAIAWALSGRTGASFLARLGGLLLAAAAAR
jgi:hypothetical protein